MEVFCKSDIGLVRLTNQDNCAFKLLSNSSSWAIVCDGMGGANGGNVASTTAVEFITGQIERLYDESLPDAKLADIMTDIVLRANKEVFELSKTDASLSGMGTTIEFVIVKNGKVHVVHAGDSRTYAIRGGKIIQLTTDHSLVQEMVARGEITEEQARIHPNRNYITRALGVSAELYVDYVEADFSFGDVVLICTDGLTNYIDKTELIRITHEHRGNDLTETLVYKAKELGGSDNITVVVMY